MCRTNTYTANAEVLAVDEHLELQGATKRAEDPWAAEEAGALGAGPAEVGRAGVNKVKRVVTGVVEADGNGVGWEPADPGVHQGTGDAIDVDLERVLADL